MRLAQQNAITSLKEECKKQMLAAAHTLAMDSKNMLDAVDQARVRANLAKPAAQWVFVFSQMFLWDPSQTFGI